MVSSNYTKKMSRVRRYLTGSPAETLKLGRRIARMLRSDDILFLSGDLGSGKTTFTRGVCQGLGIKEPVTSPSFIIVTEYTGKFKVSHIDLYRLDKADCDILPLEEYYAQGGITIIEWADRIPNFERRLTPGFYISFRIIRSNQREITIEDLRN